MEKNQKCCGIDLGTSRITVCCKGENNNTLWMTGNKQGCNWSHSSEYFKPFQEKVVCFIPSQFDDNAVLLTDTKRFFGREYNQDVLADIQKVHYPVKNEHGRIVFSVPGKDGRQVNTDASEVATDFLKYLRNATKTMTGEYIDYAVISHPATWSINQKDLLIRCAVAAGFQKISLIEEPTATAYDMLSFDMDDGYYLIYDWGGGTFDLTLMETKNGKAKVKSTDGLPYLGGVDMDALLFDYVKQQYITFVDKDSWPTQNRVLWKIAEECRDVKHDLATDDVSVCVGDEEVIVTRAAFENLISGFVDETMDKCRSILRENSLSEKDITKVVLAGGLSRIPYVQRRVAELFGEDVVEYRQDSAEKSVARGALEFGEHFKPFNTVSTEEGREKVVPNSRVQAVVMEEETKPDLEDTFSFNVYIEHVKNGVVGKRLVLEKGLPYYTEKRFQIQLDRKDTEMVVNVFVGKTEATAVFVGTFSFEASPYACVTISVRCEQGRYLFFRSFWSLNDVIHESNCDFNLNQLF